MFEVGKKYKRKRMNSLETATVLFADEKSAYLEWDHGSGRFSVPQSLCNEWDKYHEPVIETYHRYVKKDWDVLYTGPTKGHNYNVVGEVEFTLTDGKLTGVKIV